MVMLRFLTQSDEVAAMAAQAELAAENFEFLVGWTDGNSFAAWAETAIRNARGEDLPQGWVPNTFLVGEVDDELVGRVSVRHRLNPFLERYGGHIGYAVRPQFRRRGYATAMLDAALPIAKSLGLSRVLLTCDVDNVGSATVIERCGGVFESIEPASEICVERRRYWIDT